jgi:nitrite reductase/ring-hydroxylating ferredoxin subunit
MAPRTHLIPRASLPENGVVAFEVAGVSYLVADVDGDVQAYTVVGPSARKAAQAAVADGRVHCPLHGWAIDPAGGGCRASERCRYEPVPVQLDGDRIEVILSAP